MRAAPVLALLALAACAAESVPPPAPRPAPAPVASTAPSASSTSASTWKYPSPRTSDASDVYFGKTYNDPFRPSRRPEGSEHGGVVAVCDVGVANAMRYEFTPNG